MQQVTIQGFKDAVYWGAVVMREPQFGWGEPGVGKTQAIAQLVAELDTREIEAAVPAKAGAPKNIKPRTKRPGATLCDIRLAQYESVDLRGLPDTENRMTVWNLPATLPFIGNPNFNSDPDHIIILSLDEFTHGQESVMSVAYQLVNEGRVGEHVLMPNVRIVAMSNREGDKGISRRMPVPLNNRFTHVEVITSVDEFCVYAQKKGLHRMGPMFLQFCKDQLSTFMVPDGDGGAMKVTSEKAFATPRTWEKALRIYDNPDIPLATKHVLIAGTIGDATAAKFWAFEKAYDQLSKLIPAIMKDPTKAPVPEARDVMFAVTVGLSGDMTQKNADIIHTYYKRLDREFCMLGWIMASKRDETLEQTNAYLDFSKNYSRSI